MFWAYLPPTNHRLQKKYHCIQIFITQWLSIAKYSQLNFRIKIPFSPLWGWNKEDFKCIEKPLKFLFSISEALWGKIATWEAWLWTEVVWSLGKSQPSKVLLYIEVRKKIWSLAKKTSSDCSEAINWQNTFWRGKVLGIELSGQIGLWVNSIKSSGRGENWHVSMT